MKLHLRTLVITGLIILPVTMVAQDSIDWDKNHTVGTVQTSGTTYESTTGGNSVTVTTTTTGTVTSSDLYLFSNGLGTRILNDDNTTTDQICATIDFQYNVKGLKFKISDIDFITVATHGLDATEYVEVTYNGGTNIRDNASIIKTLNGVAVDDEAPIHGYEATAADSDMTIDFPAGLKISELKICHGITDDSQVNTTNLGIQYETLEWNITLPVELAYFGAAVTPAGVQLNWTTASEIENLGFVLERRVDDAEFTEIASYKTDDALLGQGSVEYSSDYEFVDSFVEAGQTYEYRLGDVDYAGKITYHATRSVTVTTTPKSGKVEQFTVLDAYPNPFNPNTTISYALPQVERNTTTTVQIYDITGKLVKTLLNAQQQSGWHSVVWNGTDQVGKQVPAGVYLSKVSFGSETKTINV